MKKKSIIIISFLCTILLFTNVIYVFADTDQNYQNLDIIEINKENIDNGSLKYGLTVYEDGSVTATPAAIFDFGMQSYDGILDLQSWSGTQIVFSIKLTSTNAKMLSHSGTISIHKVGFLGLIGDLYNSQTFNMKSDAGAVSHLSETYRMYVGNEDEIYIKLSNLKINRLNDGLLSIPSSQKKFDKSNI